MKPSQSTTPRQNDSQRFCWQACSASKRSRTLPPKKVRMCRRKWSSTLAHRLPLHPSLEAVGAFFSSRSACVLLCLILSIARAAEILPPPPQQYFNDYAKVV